MKKTLFCIALLWLTCGANAQEADDLQALHLADQIMTKPEQPSNWRIFVEGAAGGAVLRSSDSFQANQRLSFDAQYDNTFAPDWRAVFSDRLDIDNPAQAPSDRAINTIKEAYLSWQAQPNLLFDLGRINERNGVALGYNPTDYFKAAALRSVVSVDPNSLKENHQGSVMLRAQQLSDNGSLTVLFSPKLSDAINAEHEYATFNPDIAATNNINRWLVSYSPKFSNDFNPKVLLFKSEQLPTQFGLNVTSLVNDATVIYLEWSGGRRPNLLTQALQAQGIPVADTSAFRNRVSSGVTYTTDNKISISAEFDYNGTGLDQQQWSDLGRPNLLYGAYRKWLQIVQESPTKQTAFLYATWQDAGLNHLDVSAMERFNLVDSSHLTWLEARYHMTHSEFALQWQRDSGSRFSEFGAARQSQLWSLLGRFYF